MDTNKVNLLSVEVPNKQLNPIPKPLYIDKSIKSFSISVSGNSPKIDLVNPMGMNMNENLITDLNLHNVKIKKVLVSFATD